MGGTFKNRREPDAVNAQRLKVVQFLNDTAQRTAEKAGNGCAFRWTQRWLVVCSVEAVYKNLIDDSILPPRRWCPGINVVREELAIDGGQTDRINIIGVPVLLRLCIAPGIGAIAYQRAVGLSRKDGPPVKGMVLVTIRSDTPCGYHAGSTCFRFGHHYQPIGGVPTLASRLRAIGGVVDGDMLDGQPAVGGE